MIETMWLPLGTIVFEGPWPTWVVVIMAAVMVLGALFAYKHAAGSTSRPRRRLLVLVRLVAMGVLVAGLVHPIVHGTIRAVRKAQLAFLLDDSRSMSIADAEEGARRVDAVKRFFEDNADRLRNLGDSLDVSTFGFGADLAPVEPAHLAADASATDIAGALAGISNRFPERDFRYVVLVSDGVSTGGGLVDSAVRQLEGRFVKVFTVGVGAAKGASVPIDARVRNVFTTRTAFVDDILPVEVEVTASGLVGAAVPVAVLLDGEEVARQQFTPKQPFHAARLSFKVKPRQEGLVELTVRIPEQDGELLQQNNEAGTFVKVSSDALRVLYLDRIRPQYKWLHNALEKAPELVLVKKALADAESAQTSPLVPRTREDWLKYDVVIFGDIPADYFASSQIEALSEAVSAGVGFLMIGGRHNFAAGKYADTHVADVLPVVVSAEEEVNKDLFRFAPTYTGRRLEVLRLDADDARNDEIWHAMPGLAGAVRFAGTKPAARVLAVDDRDNPVCVASDYGAGRSMALAFLSTQPWAFHEGGEWAGYHARFWRQIILYLANREAAVGKPVALVSDRFNFPADKPVPLRVRVRDESGSPVPGGVITATVKRAQGEAIMQYGEFADNGQYYEKDIEKLPPGTYEVEVVASAAGKTLGADVSRFIVFEPSYELDVLRPDFAALSKIAADSRGEFFTIQYPGHIFDALAALDADVDIVRYRRRDLWRSAPVFLLFVALLSLEWFLRKRWGLV